MAIEIFCCYSREDQDLMKSLRKHLMALQRRGLITIWSDTDINAGMEWEEEIKKHLDTAQIILLTEKHHRYRLMLQLPSYQ